MENIKGPMIKRQMKKKYQESNDDQDDNNESQGIIHKLEKESPDIYNEIEITCSALPSNNENNSLWNLINYNDPKLIFSTKNDHFGSWICFDFKEHRIIPKKYYIRSGCTTSSHLKSWVIEVSNDGQCWYIADEREECPYLNGISSHHTFFFCNETCELTN